jgi:hypothetical protein
MKKEIFRLGLFLMIVLLFISCADKTPYVIDQTKHIYGFWGGVWHGAIMLPDFVMSLFYDDVAVYATNNNGFWYDFGFVGGLGLCLKVIGFILRGIGNILQRI